MGCVHDLSRDDRLVGESTKNRGTGAAPTMTTDLRTTVAACMGRAALALDQVVVASLHQPRAGVWQLVDRLTLLAGGRLVFTGVREHLQPWLSDGLGYEYRPGTHGLVCDWALDLVATGFDKPEVRWCRPDPRPAESRSVPRVTPPALGCRGAEERRRQCPTRASYRAVLFSSGFVS